MRIGILIYLLCILNKFSRLWPNYVLAHNNLATLLEDKPTAEYHLREALSIDPWHPNSLYNLAVFMR